MEIKAIKKELEEFKLQLDDISRKDSELLNKKESYEIELRKMKLKQKDKKTTELIDLTKKQKQVNELSM